MAPPRLIFFVGWVYAPWGAAATWAGLAYITVFSMFIGFFFWYRGMALGGVARVATKVKELRELSAWSEGQLWVSPERHGAMTGIMKAQIDWIPLALGAVRPTQGKTLALMQVCGGSQSFNAVNQMRILGRWMRMITIPNQSSIAKAFQEFDEHDRLKPSAYHDRVVDVLEELMKFTLLTRDVSPYLVDRYSERKESAQQLMQRVNQRAI